MLANVDYFFDKTAKIFEHLEFRSVQSAYIFLVSKKVMLQSCRVGQAVGYENVSRLSVYNALATSLSPERRQKSFCVFLMKFLILCAQCSLHEMRGR